MHTAKKLFVVLFVDRQPYPPIESSQ
jgi:hypothetical protein